MANQQAPLLQQAGSKKFENFFNVPRNKKIMLIFLIGETFTVWFSFLIYAVGLAHRLTGDRDMKAIRMATALLALTTGMALAENPMVGGAAMFDTKNIIENAVNSKDHTTLVAAVTAAGLVETLSGAGPFTVFAPTNEAFAKLPAGTVETLLKPENKDQLVKILTCHVIGAKAMAADVLSMIKTDGGAHKVKTVGGCELTLTTQDGKVMITDEMGNIATVTIADVAQSNGVIHVIDTVLLPKM